MTSHHNKSHPYLAYIVIPALLALGWAAVGLMAGAFGM